VEKVEISGTDTTPHIELNPDNGLLQIDGRSLTDEAAVFYQPVKNWLIEYAKQPAHQTELSIRLEYLNTATSRQFLDLFKVMEKIPGARIFWYFSDEDEDMEEMGQELAELVNIKIEFRSY
jgi:hypothetical protein